MAIKFTNPQTDRPSLAGQCFEISKSVSFEAAHFMPSHDTSHAYGRVHGHSFQLTAYLCAKLMEGEDWVADFARLDDVLQGLAMQLDHGLLNEIPDLAMPTLEHICAWAAKKLGKEFAQLDRVSVARPSLNEICTLKVDVRE